jgi:hypothetical protein
VINKTRTDKSKKEDLAGMGRLKKQMPGGIKEKV